MRSGNRTFCFLSLYGCGWFVEIVVGPVVIRWFNFVGYYCCPHCLRAYSRREQVFSRVLSKYSHLHIKCENRRERRTFGKNKGKINAKRGYTSRKQTNADMTEIGTHAGLSQYRKNSPPQVLNSRF